MWKSRRLKSAESLEPQAFRRCSWRGISVGLSSPSKSLQASRSPSHFLTVPLIPQRLTETCKVHPRRVSCLCKKVSLHSFMRLVGFPSVCSSIRVNCDPLLGSVWSTICVTELHHHLRSSQPLMRFPMWVISVKTFLQMRGSGSHILRLTKRSRTFLVVWQCLAELSGHCQTRPCLGMSDSARTVWQKWQKQA